LSSAFSAASGGVGDYSRDWPKELSARQADLFVRAQRGVGGGEAAD
jgi:hypothetical protein